MASPARPNLVSFGAYEFNPISKELRKEGVRVRLEGQPLAILEILLDRPGELVTREELQKKLWPAGTFVDLEHSLNAAVKRLRSGLNDSADQPRFIESAGTPRLSLCCAGGRLCLEPGNRKGDVGSM
jgi:cholera toxin transcriptional activator